MAERIPQSVAYTAIFKAYLLTTGLEATGRTIAITISKATGGGGTPAAFGNPSAGATNATEISGGWYYVALSTTDTGTVGPLAIRGTEATIQDVGIALTVATDAASIATSVWQDTTSGDFTVSGSIGKSLFTSGNAPGAANGLFIAGTNAATVVTTSLTTTFTGSLTGSVGSVTGAVGSVTGNVGGNITGSVGSVVGAVGSVTGAVGSVTGNVGGNVTGSAGSVVGAVGSVTGNVGGNVVGSVASVTAGVTVTTNNDKAGYALTSAYDAAKTAAQDGDAMTLTVAGYNAAADALLNRDMSTGTDSGSTTVRTPRQAFRFLRNKWAILTGTLTVYKEDDTTASWTATVTTDNTAVPIVGNDPAGP